MTLRILRVAAFMLRSAFVYSFLGLFNRSRREVYLPRAFFAWARYALEVFDVELKVRGREGVPPPEGGPRIFLCNHQSQLDIPVLIASLEEKIGFMAKKELGRIPLLAYWMRQLGCVLIDRADKRGARKSLEAAAAALGNRSLVIFPEGTRSKSGALLPIKLGGLRLSVMAGARIVPVHIRNSRGAFEARVPGDRGPIPVHLRFFPSLDTRGWTDERASWLKIRDYLEACWKEGETAVR